MFASILGLSCNDLIETIDNFLKVFEVNMSS
jgi:hypothetical protein